MQPLTRQPLLEREAELAQLESALAGAAAGQGQLIVVESAAGLGKSALLQAAAEQARERGLNSLSARGTELERDFPFGVVRQLLEPALALIDGKQRERAFAGAAALARALFEPLADERTAADPTYGRLHGLYWLIANLTARDPLALVIDDAHWADSPSLRFLSFLLARLEELPLALIVALRTADPGAERAPLATLAASPGALCLRPRPLSEDAVAELVGRSFGSAPEREFIAACHAATAGNPFYLGALLRELEAQGMIEGSWEHPDRRTRRYYSITPAGRREHRRLRAEVEPFLDSVISTVGLIKREIYGAG